MRYLCHVKILVVFCVRLVHLKEHDVVFGLAVLVEHLDRFITCVQDQEVVVVCIQNLPRMRILYISEVFNLIGRHLALILQIFQFLLTILDVWNILSALIL